MTCVVPNDLTLLQKYGYFHSEEKTDPQRTDWWPEKME